ncbi:ATP-binding protein [Desulfopila sp. IMCC35008]|uniref:ATP-binding protein n=1 Tax=Desulfopila sp. IMCC35008 TaxID=2653858 RepID=UPI0013D17FB3|nr:ATP-binding protein [Desulfopila sp. IMCC35008]
METETTYFAPAERASEQELAREIKLAASSPVMSGILKSVGGLIAILDGHRQIVAINDSFARMLGISDVEEAMGLRLGEAVNCIYSARQPGGCGTSEYCSTCGAVIAMVTGMATKDTVERVCAVTIKDDCSTKDIVMRVRCQPVELEDTDFLLLFLQDITEQQQKAALERVFFHVWNKQFIPDDIARRIFQRNFSTKAEEGRGIGTYSMKLFGEQVLNGKVSFTTSAENGTTFTLEHPIS